MWCFHLWWFSPHMLFSVRLLNQYYYSLCHSRDSMSWVYSNTYLFLLLTHSHLSGRSSDPIHPASVGLAPLFLFHGSRSLVISGEYRLWYAHKSLCISLLHSYCHSSCTEGAPECIVLLVYDSGLSFRRVCACPSSLAFNHFSILRDFARLGVFFIHKIIHGVT